MPIVPPDPFKIAETLRVELEAVVRLVTEHPHRAEYAAALNSIAGAAVLLEHAARVNAATKG
jgi:hypothetical protein